MKVVFRVDASNRIGTGHVVRCLTLADVLRERNTEVRFVCRAHSGNLIRTIRQRAIPVNVLPRSSDGSKDYTDWLGLSQEQDAEETIETLRGEQPDWMVVDHYGIDARWEERVRSKAKRLMVIDDIADRSHDCDLLLNQNCLEYGEQLYSDLIPPSSRQLLGPRYALLAPEYMAYRRIMRRRTGEAQRVLVFFGGSDPGNMTGKVLDVLSAPEFESLHVDVVIGTNNAHRQEIKAQISRRSLTRLHGWRPHLADLMTEADIAFGAGGSTTWERLCLGLPTVVVSIAANQVPASVTLSNRGFIWYLGKASDVQTAHLRGALTELISNTEALTELSSHGRRLVDGMGALRVAEALDPTPAERLRFRAARAEDCDLHFDWMRDGDISAIKAWEQHQERFTRDLSAEEKLLFVVQAGPLPIGQVRLEPANEEVLISFLLDPVVRDRGWGSRLLSMGLTHLFRDISVVTGAESVGGHYITRGSFVRLGSKDPRLSMERKTNSLSIAVLSDLDSWMNSYLPDLLFDWLVDGHRVLWMHDVAGLPQGDFCFYLSYGQIVPPGVLGLYRHNLVVHASDLPSGKGWSPLSWQILEGKNRISVTLFEATERVDSGVIYAQESLEFEGHELIDEMRSALAVATKRLCNKFVSRYPHILDQAREQAGNESYYPQRRPADSRLDPERGIAEQFALLRVTDNERYPAFFEHMGHEYTIIIHKRRRH